VGFFPQFGSLGLQSPGHLEERFELYAKRFRIGGFSRLLHLFGNRRLGGQLQWPVLVLRVGNVLDAIGNLPCGRIQRFRSGFRLLDGRQLGLSQRQVLRAGRSVGFFLDRLIALGEEREHVGLLDRDSRLLSHGRGLLDHESRFLDYCFRLLFIAMIAAEERERIVGLLGRPRLSRLLNNEIFFSAAFLRVFEEAEGIRDFVGRV